SRGRDEKEVGRHDQDDQVATGHRAVSGCAAQGRADAVAADPDGPHGPDGSARLCAARHRLRCRGAPRPDFREGGRFVGTSRFLPSESPAAETPRRRAFSLVRCRPSTNEDRIMKRVNENFAKPYVLRDFEFVRAGPDGAYWMSADGMRVRVAAPEDARAHV